MADTVDQKFAPSDEYAASGEEDVGLGLGDADGDGDDLGRSAHFLEAHRFLDGDLVKGVHAHLDVGEVDPDPSALTRGLTL